MAEDPVVARLLGGLEAGGVFVDEGGFTFDREGARSKLQAFRLADPNWWSLLLVQFATLLGAEKIEFQLERQKATFLAHGVALRREELADPLAGVFEARADDGDLNLRTRARAMSKFAAAYAAMLEVRGGVIEVSAPCLESGGSINCIERTGVGPTLTESDTASESQIVRVSVELGRSPTEKQVAELVQTRCMFSNLEISLNGKRVGRGWRHALSTREFWRGWYVDIHDEAGRPIGIAGFKQELFSNAQLIIMADNVEIERLDLLNLLELRNGFTAIVDCDLSMDISQTKAVRDVRFDRLMSQVVDAHGRAMQELAAPERSRQRPQPFDSVTQDSSSFWKTAIVIGLGYVAILTVSVMIDPSTLGPHLMLIGLALGLALLASLHRRFGES